MTRFIIKHPFSDPESRTPQLRVLGTLGDPRIGDYLLQDPEGRFLAHGQEEEVDVPRVGRGGQAVVVRALHYRNRFSRALKILDLAGVRSAYYGAVPGAGGEAEVAIHSANHFKHTLPIVDCGTETDANGERIVFYALPYIPGDEVGVFFGGLRGAARREELLASQAARAALHDDVLVVLRQIAEALCEYESRGLIHMDVSAPNILVRDRTGSSPLECYLLDLGSARALADLPDGPTAVFIKPWYFPLHRVRKAGIDQLWGADIRALGHRIDLYSFGRLLYALFFDVARLGTPPSTTVEGQETERFWRTVLGPSGTFEFLKELADRLLVFGIESPSHLRDAIYPEGLVQGGPFLWSGAFSPHLPGIRVRVRGRVLHVPRPFSVLVDHPAVQRLRRLHQLSLVDQVFPGATHTRFLHALQVFDLSRQYLVALSRSHEARLTLTRRSTEEILAAALLHDVGQFPFSHAIEDLRKCDGAVAPDSDEANRVLYDQEVAEMVMQETIDGHPTLCNLLAAEGLRSETVNYILQKGPRDLKQDPVSQLGRDIVAGMIDADRVAYLIQDSDAAGVAFGRHVDVASLLEGLRVCWIDGVPRLGIDEKALSAAEGILAGVYWMYRNVYWHHMNRGIMAAVKFTFRELLGAKALQFRDYLKKAWAFSDFEAAKFLDGEFRTVFGSNARSPLHSLASFGRLGYKRVLSLAHAQGDSTEQGLWERLVRAYSVALERDLLADLRRRLLPGRELRPGEVLLDVPLKPRLLFLAPELASSPQKETLSDVGLLQSRVWLTRGPGHKPRDIVTCSSLIRDLTWMEHVSSRRIRVFLAEEYVTAENRASLGTRAKQAIQDLLDERDSRTTRPLR